MIFEKKDHVPTEADYQAWANNDSPEKRVEFILAELSEEILWAGWHVSIEFHAWWWVNEGFSDFDLDSPRGQIAPDVRLAMLEELKTLTVDAGWWPHYPGESLNGYKMPLDEWKAYVDAGTERLRAAFFDE